MVLPLLRDYLIHRYVNLMVGNKACTHFRAQSPLRLGEHMTDVLKTKSAMKIVKWIFHMTVHTRLTPRNFLYTLYILDDV